MAYHPVNGRWSSSETLKDSRVWKYATFSDSPRSTNEFCCIEAAAAFAALSNQTSKREGGDDDSQP
jgi:hypothetical protein